MLLNKIYKEVDMQLCFFQLTPSSKIMLKLKTLPWRNLHSRLKCPRHFLNQSAAGVENGAVWDCAVMQCVRPALACDFVFFFGISKGSDTHTEYSTSCFFKHSSSCFFPLPLKGCSFILLTMAALFKWPCGESGSCIGGGVWISWIGLRAYDQKVVGLNPVVTSVATSLQGP